MLLGVHLDVEPVGELTVVGEAVEFRLLETYRARYPRRVLGQVFEDDLSRVHRSRVKLPPFFSNLLPEGALRELVARQIGVKAERESYLLAQLGDDLPGATRVVVLDPTDEDDTREIEARRDEPSDLLKFSLAGVQLKFSAVHASGRGMTIPAHGRGGDWIVKLPDPRFPGVPENEWSMMTLARRVGLDVAEVQIVPLASIEGLPGEVRADPSAMGLAIRRFDRAAGKRVHMEDFAQILDVRPRHWDKYHSANFETIARIVASVAPGSVEELVRRLVFNAAIGNGDAHIKNWSLLYPDGVSAVLSPAYDLVSTIQYLPDDDLGLNLARSKRFEDVGLASFQRLTEKADLNVPIDSLVGDTVARIREGWAQLRSSLPMSDGEKKTIDAHFARVPVMQGG
jgi:serine/threonine-protein kinase HipA